MKGRTNCGFSSGGNIKYIPACATLTILAPTDATVQVSNGTISQILDDTYKTNIVDIYNIYNYYIKPSQFGVWDITITFDDNSRITSVTVDETKEYKINSMLPDLYQHIQYIGPSTNGNDTAERINTSIVPTSNTCISCHYLVLPGVDHNSNKWRNFFGVDGTDGESDSFKLQQYYGTCTAQVGVNGSYTEISNIGFDAGMHYVKIDLKHEIGIVDDITKPLILDSLEFTSPIGIVRSQYDATSANSNYGYQKVQDFKIYEDDILIRYFVPCYRRSDSVIGMYELLTNEFYITAGTTGGFTKGPDLTF